ncbi:Hypothetical protein CINCED_3A005017 [Cinara cedri]|nr:Hypothetical protein CINCED_3A005017 [Cinara cedri]
MYWNELNPQKRNVSFKFDNSDLKKHKDRILVRIKRKVFHFIHLFFSSSNIHGFNHLTDETRHFTEKFVWAIAIGLSIYGSTILGSSTWTRYQENPTVISMDREYREWATAFPAVTLCPTSEVDVEEFEKLMNSSKFINFNEDDRESFRNFMNLLSNASYETFKDVPEDNRIQPEDYLDYVKLLSTNISYIISNSHVNMFPSFSLLQTITELGICYSYNGEITPYNDYEYWITRNKSKIPSKGIMSGSPLDGDIFVQITSMNFGYMGFLHSSYEVPDIACRIHSSPENFYKTLDVTALSIYSTPEVKDLTPKQRGCRFLNESNLEISPAVYTYNMCRIQCRMKQANKLCGCVPFYYKPLDKYKICDVKGMHCLDQYKEFLVNLRNASGVKVNCGCLPPCDDVNYIVEADNTIQW